MNGVDGSQYCSGWGHKQEWPADDPNPQPLSTPLPAMPFSIDSGIKTVPPQLEAANVRSNEIKIGSSYIFMANGDTFRVYK